MAECNSYQEVGTGRRANDMKYLCLCANRGILLKEGNGFVKAFVCPTCSTMPPQSTIANKPDLQPLAAKFSLSVDQIEQTIACRSQLGKFHEAYSSLNGSSPLLATMPPFPDALKSREGVESAAKICAQFDVLVRDFAIIQEANKRSAEVAEARRKMNGNRLSDKAREFNEAQLPAVALGNSALWSQGAAAFAKWGKGELPFAPSCLLYGNPRLGKTQLGLSLGLLGIQNSQFEKKIAYVDAQEFAEAAHRAADYGNSKSFSNGRSYPREIVEKDHDTVQRSQSAEVLVLDNFGFDADMPDWKQRQLVRLLNTRHAKRWATILISDHGSYDTLVSAAYACSTELQRLAFHVAFTENRPPVTSYVGIGETQAKLHLGVILQENKEQLVKDGRDLSPLSNIEIKREIVQPITRSGATSYGFQIPSVGTVSLLSDKTSKSHSLIKSHKENTQEITPSSAGQNEHSIDSCLTLPAVLAVDLASPQPQNMQQANTVIVHDTHPIASQEKKNKEFKRDKEPLNYVAPREIETNTTLEAETFIFSDEPDTEGSTPVSQAEGQAYNLAGAQIRNLAHDLIPFNIAGHRRAVSDKLAPVISLIGRNSGLLFPILGNNERGSLIDYVHRFYDAKTSEFITMIVETRLFASRSKKKLTSTFVEKNSTSRTLASPERIIELKEKGYICKTEKTDATHEKIMISGYQKNSIHEFWIQGCHTSADDLTVLLLIYSQVYQNHAQNKDETSLSWTFSKSEALAQLGKTKSGKNIANLDASLHRLANRILGYSEFLNTKNGTVKREIEKSPFLLLATNLGKKGRFDSYTATIPEAFRVFFHYNLPTFVEHDRYELATFSGFAPSILLFMASHLARSTDGRVIVMKRATDWREYMGKGEKSLQTEGGNDQRREPVSLPNFTELFRKSLAALEKTKKVNYQETRRVEFDRRAKRQLEIVYFTVVWPWSERGMPPPENETKAITSQTRPDDKSRSTVRP